MNVRLRSVFPMLGLVDGLHARLDQEDRTLGEIGDGIAQVDAVLPALSRLISRCLIIGRLLAWLVVAVAGLHGISIDPGEP